MGLLPALKGDQQRAEEVSVISNRSNDNTWEFRSGSPQKPEQHAACQETRRGGRQTSLGPVPFLAICLILVLAGCAPASSALAGVPVTGSAAADDDADGGAAPAVIHSNAPLAVHEYALVEQSADNPTYLGFQERVPQAVALQRAGWGFSRGSDTLAEHNRALEPFGFHLETSASAPFSGYTLYHHETPVQHEIARFWPVSLEQAGADFALPFVTHSGEALVASSGGVQHWSGQAQDGIQGRLAYTQTQESQVSLYTGVSAYAGAAEPAGVDPQAAGYDTVFGEQVIDGQPLYFFTHGGYTRVNFNGKDLPYVYDQVLHENSGELAVYNPGSTGRVAWFYALRDGLWYYVEVGKFE